MTWTRLVASAGEACRAATRRNLQFGSGHPGRVLVRDRTNSTAGSASGSVGGSRTTWMVNLGLSWMPAVRRWLFAARPTGTSKSLQLSVESGRPSRSRTSWMWIGSASVCQGCRQGVRATSRCRSARPLRNCGPSLISINVSSAQLPGACGHVVSWSGDIVPELRKRVDWGGHFGPAGSGVNPGVNCSKLCSLVDGQTATKIAKRAISLHVAR
jgi:hypothetical protein